MTPWTVADVLARLPAPATGSLPAPPYAGPREDGRARVGLATAANRRHTTDEGWQVFAGLEAAGYGLFGRGLPLGRVSPCPDCTDVRRILAEADPGTVLVQDEREWQGLTAGATRRRDLSAKFVGVEALRARPDVWTGTIVKDAQSNPPFHRESAERMGAHFWVCYYAPAVVARLAPYVRPEHLVRTWHTVNPADVPPYSPSGRRGALLSGALSGAYPLRQRLVREIHRLPGTDWLRHPGYHARGCHTPQYLRDLSRYRVSICTASVYGYALRKLVESTAAGCVVVTDLPADEVVPAIDANLVRVRPDATTAQIADLVASLCAGYDAERQEHFARLAVERFAYQAEGRRLAGAIEDMRRGYNDVRP